MSWRPRWLRTWRANRARRARGRAGEARVAAVLDNVARQHGARARHQVPLRSRRRRRGDLDHALLPSRRRPAYFIAIETKAERPHPGHFAQVTANAERASRHHFRGAPSYRIVVHPNSNEPVVYDPHKRVARTGLPELPGYLASLLQGAHPERLTY